MHPENKEDNCEQDKSEPGDIKIQTMEQRGEHHFGDLDNRIEKEAEQACEEFMSFPLQRENHSCKRDDELDIIVQDNAFFKECRVQDSDTRIDYKNKVIFNDWVGNGIPPRKRARRCMLLWISINRTMAH